MNFVLQPWQLLLAIQAVGVPQVGGLPHGYARVAQARSRTSQPALVVVILPADKVFGTHNHQWIVKNAQQGITPERHKPL
jgi:hypothetical protein